MAYSDMKATKTSKKTIDTSTKISRKTAKSTQKTAKKAGFSLILLIICLFVGVAGGFAVSKFVFSSDTFEMVTYASGETDIYIGNDEKNKTYTELGVKCIAFGKDISNECTVTYYFRDDLTQDEVQVDGVDTETAGIYYAVYKCNNIKYSSVTLIRNIIVLKEEDNG